MKKRRFVVVEDSVLHSMTVVHLLLLQLAANQWLKYPYTRVDDVS